MMSTTHLNEPNNTEEYPSSREEQRQRYPSTNSSTPNSVRGERQFQFTNNERSGQNSRTSSVAESTTSINNEGFSNLGDIVQHLQAVWYDHNHDGPRRTGSTSTTNPNVNETVPPHYSKGHSQQHYTHHQSGQSHNQYSGQQHWNNYNNPRRSGGGGNYNRNYSGGNNEIHWNSKSNRFPSHRSMNNLMTNPVNYQQQQQQQQQQQSQVSPPTQRRQGDQQQYYHNEQPSQSYYKKNRSDHDRRQNGYTSQQPSDYSSTNSASEQSNISSTQSYPSNLNSYNR